MRVVKTFLSSFIGAFVGVVAAMLITSLFESHAFTWSVAVGISCGAAIANAIREWRQVSPEKFSWLIACCVGAGSIIGTWISGPG